MALSQFNFSKNWTSASDFPTYESDEVQVRADLQFLHDELKDAFNALIEAISAPAGAGEIGADIEGLAGATVATVLASISAEIASRYTKAEVDASVATATNESITDVAFDARTGKFTFTHKDGSVKEFDTLLEKIPLSCSLVQEGNNTYLRMQNADGSTFQTNVSNLFNEYNFFDTDTVGYKITASSDGSKIIQAHIKDNSITLDKLSTTLVSTLAGYESSARSSATAAAESASTASSQATKASNAATRAEVVAQGISDYAVEARSYAVGGTDSRLGEDEDNAMYYAQQAQAQAGKAKEYADQVKDRVEGSFVTQSELTSTENTLRGEILQAKADAIEEFSAEFAGELTGVNTRITDLEKADASLADVAKSGSYNDLSDKPELKAVATSGSYDDLSDKPELKAVATSGSYEDLSDKPFTPTEASYKKAVAAYGKTAGTDKAYTLAFAGYTLEDGNKVVFKLHKASGANPTLNVNGTGAKALKTAGNTALTTTPVNVWLTAVYSSELNAYILQGSNGGSDGGIKSITVESETDTTVTVKFTNTDDTSNSVTYNKAPGAKGNGIKGIAKTGTNGLVDTYTVTLDDGATETFTVTNGEKGDQGNGIKTIEKDSENTSEAKYKITLDNGDAYYFFVPKGSGGTSSGGSSSGDMLKEYYDKNDVVKTAGGIVDYVNQRLNNYTPNWDKVSGKPTFAPVATSGSYDDLSGKPNLATVATSGSYTDLSGKPSLFSGDYNDLSNKPTIPQGDMESSEYDSGDTVKNAGGIAAYVGSKVKPILEFGVAGNSSAWDREDLYELYNLSDNFEARSTYTDNDYIDDKYLFVSIAGERVTGSTLSAKLAEIIDALAKHDELPYDIMLNNARNHSGFLQLRPTTIKHVKGVINSQQRDYLELWFNNDEIAGYQGSKNISIDSKLVIRVLVRAGGALETNPSMAMCTAINVGAGYDAALHVRASTLDATHTDPSVEGTISWLYE